MTLFYWLLMKLKRPYKPKPVHTYNVQVQEKVHSMTHFPVLLLEIGELQVYTFQTREEFDKKIPVTEVFWRERDKAESFGPFKSVYEACNHYTYTVREVRTAKNNVIRVNFKTKKRF